MASFFAVTSNGEDQIYDEPYYKAFLAKAAELYPQTAKSSDLVSKISPNLVSPHVTELPMRLRAQAQEIVKAFFDLRQSPAWQNRLKSQNPNIPDPGNTSILMSYDFHVDANENLRLIEINTNASMSLIADISHQVHGIENVFASDFRAEIFKTFQQEALASSVVASADALNVAIVDEQPEQQRLLIEFKFFQELFQSRGWSVGIHDPEELRNQNGRVCVENKALDLIYNRDTDFYFTKPASQALKDAMLTKSACITPHPFEYLLLADKERLLDLSRKEIVEGLGLPPSQNEIISRTLIATRDVRSFKSEDLWAARKKYFFKPRNSHGGKAVYRGASITKSTFETVMNGDYLAQEMVPPALLKFKNSTSNEEIELKSDLRFYVYRDRIQMACARLYRGQMTNAQTPGGGLSIINWT